MELTSLELQPTLSTSRRKAREAYLIDRGKTLSLDQTVWTEGMNIELFLFILGMGPGEQAPSLFLTKLKPAEPEKNFFFQADPPFSRRVQVNMDLLLTW